MPDFKRRRVHMVDIADFQPLTPWNMLAERAGHVPAAPPMAEQPRHGEIVRFRV
jgi:hypothetical protein